METTIYADNIFYIDGLIKNPIGLMESIETSNEHLTDVDAITKWEDWIASGGTPDDIYVYGSIKHTDESKLETSSEEVKYIYRTISNALNKAGRTFCAANGISYIDPAPISISKYIEGAGMGPHIDRDDQPHVEPLMSAVLYLNDDYEGGELSFADQGVEIKPKAGSIVIFPSAEPFYHESKPVTRGQKFIVPAFWKQIIR